MLKPNSSVIGHSFNGSCSRKMLVRVVIQEVMMLVMKTMVFVMMKMIMSIRNGIFIQSMVLHAFVYGRETLL